MHNPGGQKKPKPIGHPFETRCGQAVKLNEQDLGDIRKLVTWRRHEKAEYDPTGHTVNLGKFKKNVMNCSKFIDNRSDQSSFVCNLEKMQAEQEEAWNDEENETFDLDK